MTYNHTPDPPFLISWNITRQCNLKCEHCYIDATDSQTSDETSPEEALRFIDEIASLAPGAMLILTGGEPLLRPDVFDIAKAAASKGLTVVLGSNGTLIDERVVTRLQACNIKGVGLSLDSPSAAYHDAFRGMTGAWAKTMAATRALRNAGMEFQIQFTATAANRHEIPEMAKLAWEAGAIALNVFFLVCTGRGQKAADLTPVEYEEALNLIVKTEEEYRDRIMVRARCAPHILRIISSTSPDSPLGRGATSGCIAGKGYMRISPAGRVTPCPYIPVEPHTPSIRQRRLRDVWEHDPVFLALRQPEYKGRCGDCEFSELCGGCRAKAYASTRDIMAEDPWCQYVPKGKKPALFTHAPVWTEAANKRLAEAPVFLRTMIKSGVERYARHNSITEITPELMAVLKRRMGR